MRKRIAFIVFLSDYIVDGCDVFWGKLQDLTKIIS
jgi:hypothetical protein